MKPLTDKQMNELIDSLAGSMDRNDTAKLYARISEKRPLPPSPDEPTTRADIILWNAYLMYLCGASKMLGIINDLWKEDSREAAAE